MKKRISLLCAVVMACGLFSGCGMEGDISIHPDLSSTITSRMLITEEELRALGEGMLTEEDIQRTLADMEKITRDGAEYYCTEESMDMSKSEFEGQLGRVDENCIAVYTGTASLDALPPEEKAMLDEMLGTADYSMSFSVDAPFTIADSNADKFDGEHMEFAIDLDSDVNVIYAVKDVSLLEGKDIQISGVKDGGFYKEDCVVTVNTKDGIVDLYDAKLNGKPVAFWNAGNPYNQFATVGEGKYTVSATLVSGTKKSVSFTVDGTSPKANVLNKKTYKAGKKVTFSDAVSGIKSAKLDGKNVKSGKKITKKGSHKLVLTDKAGNKTTIKFKIK